MTLNLAQIDQLVQQPEGQLLVLDYARQVVSDRERAECLIKLTRQGNSQAAEELLEMKAILGELSCVSQEINQVLKEYLPTKGLELAGKLLREGHIPKVKTLVQQLKKLPRNSVLFQSLADLAASFFQEEAWSTRQCALEILAVCPELEGKWLMQAFQDKRVYTRVLTISMLTRWLSGRAVFKISGLEGEQLYQFIYQACQDSSPPVREKAILAMVHLQHQEIPNFLQEIACRAAETLKVRIAAIQALSQIMSSDGFWTFIYQLRADDRFSMRLYIRELILETGIVADFETTEFPVDNFETDDTLYWSKYYCFLSDQYNTLDLLLQEWWQSYGEKKVVPQGTNQELITRLRAIGPVEKLLPQILDFYLDGEAIILGKPGTVRSTERFQLFRSILLSFGMEALPILTELLYHVDVYVRSAAIEALGELAIDGQARVEVKRALVGYLQKATNPPDQERILATLYVFPDEDLIPTILPFLSSYSPKVVVRAASLLNSLVKADNSECINICDVLEQIMQNVRERKVFGRLWGDLALYTANIINPVKCGVLPLSQYLSDADYLVRRFAREVEYQNIMIKTNN